MSATPLLDTLYRAGHLRVIDHALAQSLRRLDPDTPDAVLAGAALASLAVSRGHAGFMPAQPRTLLDAGEAEWPHAEDWLAQLQASQWVATPDDGLAESESAAPLVLEHGLLYLRRYREYERRLAQGLLRIGAHQPAAGEIEALAPLYARLFPDAAGDDDRQAQAAALALRHALLLVTGGPGTGKTTTITRVLVLLAAQAQAAGWPAPRIALAAPTGRAAERMAESVRSAVQSLTTQGVDADLCAPLPATGTTLHRLLGSIPDSPSFRHQADSPLPFEVVVVDEASMIDLPLMAKLVEAVPPGARLILIGDPDQLPSVEAGDVLSAILSATTDESQSNPVGAPHGRDALGLDPAPTDAPTDFPARRIHLTRNYRQDASLDLAPLATAVREGDTPTALHLLRSNTLAGVHFHEDLTDPLHTHRDHLLAHFTALADAPSPAEALALAARLRLLTAVREGPQGARALNARIEDLLAARAAATGNRRASATGATGAAGNRHFHGRLLLITENSYRHRLFNGDIGICLEGEGGILMAWFPGGDASSPRPFHPAALPAHESAFAMTVHKAQGSEFDQAWLILPARINRVLTRELIYTGITRARSQLHLAASEAVLREALSRHASRWSGLGWRLGAGETETRPADACAAQGPRPTGRKQP